MKVLNWWFYVSDFSCFVRVKGEIGIVLVSKFYYMVYEGLLLVYICWIYCVLGIMLGFGIVKKKIFVV